MDNLQNLMQCLDDISKLIPEGTYLEMCDNLKQVHKTLPKPRERRVPFQPIVVESDSESESESEEEDEPWRPEWYDEWAQNEECLRRLLVDLRVAKRTLAVLKPIQRITKKVREAAMKHFAARTQIFDETYFTRIVQKMEFTLKPHLKTMFNYPTGVTFHPKSVRSSRARSLRRKFTKSTRCSKTVASMLGGMR